MLEATKPANAGNLAEELKRAQETAARARAEAFVDYAPTVAGETLRPITLRSYATLVATGNGFVTGAPLSFNDLVNFVWIHSPQFGQFNRRAKRRLTRRVFFRLNPLLSWFNEGARIAATFPRFRWLRHLAGPTAHELQSEAVAEAARLIAEARGDFPTSDSDSGEPAPFATQAHILNLFRRELGMTFEETLSIPMKQLTQHYREIIHHSSRGKAVLVTPAEADVWRRHLDAVALAARKPDTESI